jgi:repressor LexA
MSASREANTMVSNRPQRGSRQPPGQSREAVYRFVRARLVRGAPPTVREVQEALGFHAVESARAHLEALVREGRLRKEEGQSRGYRLPDVAVGTAAPVMVPLLGRVPAGALDAAVEDLEGYLPVTAGAVAEGLFALRVKGRSMVGLGIMPGDVVIVRRQPAAEPGDVVVALVDDDATVKVFRPRRGRVELHAANPDFPPLVPDPLKFRLLGKVVEVRRFLEGARGRR